MYSDLAFERAARGLPDYRRRVGTAWWMRRARPEGQAGHLDTLGRGRLRTMIARMVADDPRTSNPSIVEAFSAATGIYVTDGAVRAHRRNMGLPETNQEKGRPVVALLASPTIVRTHARQAASFP